MKFLGGINKQINIIGLFLVWIIVSSIFGFITFISLYAVLLLLQMISVYILETQTTKRTIKQNIFIFISGLIIFSCVVGFVVAFYIEVPVWYRLFVLFAQGIFTYAEVKIVIEAKKALKDI
ncbi:hypothetical protein [Paenibacillus sp. CGMCC 1.18879]|uniref:hypothetical protein n=1 Tax=Paenibacillus sp. CGMCC 1.18879 TaxID=2834466 RepID=UPI001CA88E45|nr:hypothetical protein [Paenibacillus sp. CGMCC 1.18879]MBY9079726.1 hypothetical protein [Paenibacillus sp. CGMCC 1.18879]